MFCQVYLHVLRKDEWHGVDDDDGNSTDRDSVMHNVVRVYE